MMSSNLLSPTYRLGRCLWDKFILTTATLTFVQFTLFSLCLHHVQLASTSQQTTTHDVVNSPVVMTHTGYVKGSTVTSANGKTLNVWNSIPYAQPPIGHLRFRHPRPMDPWKGVRDVTQKPNICFQLPDTYFGEHFEGSNMWNPNGPLSEDCLYLTVWSPTPTPNKAAVMVWIYGGGFQSGSTTLDVYDGRTLASEENVVVVAMQYRLASLGFLYFDHSDAPGNAGLFDQLMALQWIKENIEEFGGNPLNVTLFGESAGAGSVAFHLMSPLSRDLFQQGILQSGSSNSPWATTSKEDITSKGISLAQAVGCPTNINNRQSIIECLRKVDPLVLLENESEQVQMTNPFIPVVDGAFIPEHPRKALEANNFKHCPILIGSNADEGSYFLLYLMPDVFKKEENISISHDVYVDSVKRFFPNYNPIIHQAVTFEYTEWSNPDDPVNNLKSVERMVGDYFFTCNINEFAYRYAQAGNDVYKYYFAHRSTRNPWPKWAGVMHADEINFVFGEPFNSSKGYQQPEVQLSKKMMRYWANFAKTGNPNSSPDGGRTDDWPIHTPHSREYLTLDTNSIAVIDKGPRIKSCAFWKEYIPQLSTAIEGKKLSSGVQGTISLSDRWSTTHIFTPLLLILFFLQIRCGV